MMQAQAEKNYQKYDFPAPQRTSFFYSPKTGTCLYVFEYDTSVLSFGEVLFDAQNDTVLAHEFGKYDTDQEKDKKFKETVKSYQ